MELDILIEEQILAYRNSPDGVQINDQVFDHKIKKLNDRRWLIYAHNKVYDLEIVETMGNELRLKINGKSIRSLVKNDLDILLNKLGMSSSNHTAVKELHAPMPGTILELQVAEQQEVQKGDPLLILVAMKMENILKSPSNGTIKSVHIKPGENVEKNQLLLQFE